MADEDFYRLLGIDPHSPDREVKRAYYNLARELHPDKAKSPDEARVNAERLAGISKAYNTLKDPDKRKAYDETRKGRGGVASAPSSPSPRAGAPAAPAASPPGGAKPVSGSAQPPAGNAPKMASSDIAAQKVLTAQKAFVKGMEFYKNQEFKKALPFFEAAVQNDPESEPHYHMKLAICLLRTKGSFTRAVEAAEKAVSMDNYNIEFKLTIGEIYETVGVKSKAQQVYQDVLNWEPENDKAKARLASLKVEHQRENPSFLAKLLPSLFKK